MKVVYESGKVECGTILNPVTLAMRARYATMIEVLPKQSWHDQKLIDNAKSGGQERAMIEHHEGSEIKDQSWDGI